MECSPERGGHLIANSMEGMRLPRTRRTAEKSYLAGSYACFCSIYPGMRLLTAQKIDSYAVSGVRGCEWTGNARWASTVDRRASYAPRSAM